MMRPARLSSQIAVTQIVVLLATLIVGFGVLAWRLQVHFGRLYEQRALSVAESVAAEDTIADEVTAGDPHGLVQGQAQAVRAATGAAYIVVTNARGIRYSHPDPALIGKPVYSDPEPPKSEPFRTGRPWVGVQRGTLGLTARGKAPLFDERHGLVGEVSVGFPEASVVQRVTGELPTIAAYLLAMLGLGVVGALVLARRLKRQTFGLELGEIAALLQEREAMLHGIREGVLGVDRAGVILLANDEVRDLLSLPADAVGRPFTDCLAAGRVRDIVAGVVEGPDSVVVVEGRVLVANRMPIRADHRRHLGWVVTFHDRTEPEGLLRELDTVLALTEALRAQSHEFTNRLHTLVGLVELGRYDEAVGFVAELSQHRSEVQDRLAATIGNPMVVALLMAKTAVALERGVDLRVSPDSEASGELTDPADAVTVLGNLIDNAMEAGAACPGGLRVEVQLRTVGAGLIIQVTDNGPGIPPEQREMVFVDGYSTKVSRSGAQRGIGLAVVRQIVQRRGGMIEISGGAGGDGERRRPSGGELGGARFTVWLPDIVRARPEPAASRAPAELSG